MPSSFDCHLKGISLIRLLELDSMLWFLTSFLVIPT